MAAVASAATAITAFRLQRRAGAASAFLAISERFESAQYREYRRVIYGVDRKSFSAWTEAEREAVNAWCAHLDVVAVLYQRRQLDRKSLLHMYGDVILRSMYQVAPYCNDQLETRGAQFLLPSRLLCDELVTLWRREARRRRFPYALGFPALPSVRLAPDIIQDDAAMRSFAVGGRHWF